MSAAHNVEVHRSFAAGIATRIDNLLDAASPAAKPCLLAARTRCETIIVEATARASKLGGEETEVQNLRAAMSKAAEELKKCRAHREHFLDSGKFTREDLSKLDEEIAFQLAREQSSRRRFERAGAKAADIGRLEQLSRQLRNDWRAAEESSAAIARALLEESTNRGAEQGQAFVDSDKAPNLATIGLLLASEPEAIAAFEEQIARSKSKRGRITAEGGGELEFAPSRDGEKFNVPPTGAAFREPLDERVEKLRAAYKARFGRVMVGVARTVDAADRDKFASTFAAALGAA